MPVFSPRGSQKIDDMRSRGGGGGGEGEWRGGEGEVLGQEQTQREKQSAGLKPGSTWCLAEEERLIYPPESTAPEMQTSAGMFHRKLQEVKLQPGATRRRRSNACVSSLRRTAGFLSVHRFAPTADGTSHVRVDAPFTFPPVLAC